MYHASGFVLVGVSALSDWEPVVMFIIAIVVFAFTAFRYLDLLSTLVAFASFAGFIFYELFNAGGIYEQIIPFAFILVFGIFYFLTKRIQKQERFLLWTNNLILLEALTLLVVYAAGNYFVVRELSVSMMSLFLEESDDIPFAFIFYILTVVIPIVYLYFGIKNKDVVLLRVSLLAFAFSVFTFKYYYGFGHPEYSLTIAGAIVTALTILLLNYLKITRNGYARELAFRKMGEY